MNKFVQRYLIRPRDDFQANATAALDCTSTGRRSAGHGQFSTFVSLVTGPGGTRDTERIIVLRVHAPKKADDSLRVICY
ncbi:MAG: hypothetical protein M3O82_08225 [Verrucomicrobiota bacterium]|nr:hypothetical protein [Verrucomicrobiota bacterium]